MELTKQMTVNASADKVWKIVGTDFNDISEWASPVLDSHANPDLAPGEKGRVCEVKGAGQVIENIYDYTYAIEALKIGQKVKVVVQRGDKRITLEVTPGSRD